MNDEPQERELSEDELELVSAAGATGPLTQYAAKAVHQLTHAKYGIVDDSV